MDKNNQKLRYFLYARKSSESEDRQIQSIDDQVNRLKQLTDSLGLTIKKIYTEAKSAKKPNNRPLFDEMLQRIENGEADGILCWQINRLSRNPIDSGRLSWMLQQGKLKSIQTIDRQYLPDDNVILFNVETGSANQFILDLRKAVKRGVDSKLVKGWRPGSAPQGYLNSKIKERGENDIAIDPERFPLIRKMWDLMLTGNYTPPKILEIANNEWGYRIKASKRRPSRPLSRTGIYAIFTNPFYYGYFEFGRPKQLYKGIHQPMITMEEFDRVQILLGRKGKARPKKHHFAFTGSIRCEECGCLYTAIEKEKLIKEDGKLKTFTYYYCTRKKKDIKCTQKKALTKDNLELQIEQEIEKYTILPEFLGWALEILNEKNDREIEDRSKIYETQQKAVAQAQNELDELTKMRYRMLIDDETFLKEKKELQLKITKLKEQLAQTESRADKWLELTEKTFTFAAYARQKFINAEKENGLEKGLELKKEILMTLGATPVIQRGKIVIEPNDWLVPIKNDYPALEEQFLRLELNKIGLNKHKTEALASVRTVWRGRWDLNPRSPP